MELALRLRKIKKWPLRGSKAPLLSAQCGNAVDAAAKINVPNGDKNFMFGCDGEHEHLR